MRLIDVDALIREYPIRLDHYDKEHGNIHFVYGIESVMEYVDSMPTIDAVEVVRCRECKHRPIKEDPNGENYGFNLIEPTEGDERCPCLVSDGWYSWMPNDNFYCGYGEREGE